MYYNTPIRDFYLDLAKFRPIRQSANDRLVTITPKYENRPDLFAHMVYGTPSLWWVLVMRNMDVLIDPVEDFRAGVEIWVPAPESVGGES
jgi:hypothetical protein